MRSREVTKKMWSDNAVSRAYEKSLCSKDAVSRVCPSHFTQDVSWSLSTGVAQQHSVKGGRRCPSMVYQIMAHEFRNSIFEFRIIYQSQNYQLAHVYKEHFCSDVILVERYFDDTVAARYRADYTTLTNVYNY